LPIENRKFVAGWLRATFWVATAFPRWFRKEKTRVCWRQLDKIPFPDTCNVVSDEGKEFGCAAYRK
jgi:hypothetical protein